MKKFQLLCASPLFVCFAVLLGGCMPPPSQPEKGAGSQKRPVSRTLKLPGGGMKGVLVPDTTIRLTCDQLQSLLGELCEGQELLTLKDAASGRSISLTMYAMSFTAQGASDSVVMHGVKTGPDDFVLMGCLHTKDWVHFEVVQCPEGLSGRLSI